jgi:RNA polymerase sigma factor (sigma-70 family)
MKKALQRTRRMMAAVVVGAALVSSFSVSGAQAAPSEQTVSDISRYCQACWRNARLHPDSWTDATQEVFSRLLERVETSRWTTLLKNDNEDRREFLRAIDAVKKRTQRTKKYSGLAEDVSDEPEAARNELREELDRAALQVLNLRQQRIVQLTCEGWSVPEIADELRTTVERVSDEKYKAIRKLRKHINVA